MARPAPRTTWRSVWIAPSRARNRGWAFLFSAVDKIEATDPKTVVVTLTTPWAPFEADLALYGASIFPKAALDAQKDQLWEHPIGTGPFMFDSWEKGAQIVLKKNPTYWDEGKPYLDELTFKVLTDSNARMLQFQGGELDIATDVPFNQIEPLSANPDFVLVPDAVAKIDYIASQPAAATAGRQEAAPGDQLRGRQGLDHPERALWRRQAGHDLFAADAGTRSRRHRAIPSTWRRQSSSWPSRRARTASSSSS